MTHELFVQGLLKFGLVGMVSGSEHPDWPVTVHLKKLKPPLVLESNNNC